MDVCERERSVSGPVSLLFSLLAGSFAGPSVCPCVCLSKILRAFRGCQEPTTPVFPGPLLLARSPSTKLTLRVQGPLGFSSFCQISDPQPKIWGVSLGESGGFPLLSFSLLRLQAGSAKSSSLVPVICGRNGDSIVGLPIPIRDPCHLSKELGISRGDNPVLAWLALDAQASVCLAA